jgi:hypothetical protein
MRPAEGRYSRKAAKQALKELHVHKPHAKRVRTQAPKDWGKQMQQQQQVEEEYANV